jgi:hypothetical protein
MFFFAGREKAQFLTVEYFFIYIPFLAFLALMILFSDSLTVIPNTSGMNVIYVLQSVGSGVTGGLVLLPRLIFVSNSTKGKLLITSISALVVAVFYFLLRFLLLSVLASL